ncbi:MAG: galactokinase [FCB group bacterium]|nr:galactokinase [FCB group bacterium]
MILSELADIDAMEHRFRQHGFSGPVATDKAALLVQCMHNLEQRGVDKQSSVIVFFIPGRLEVLGKHTDYAGGRSIVAAVGQGFCAIAVARKDSLMRICDGVTGDYAEFDIIPDLTINQEHWTNYPMTVARRLRRNFSGALRGADVVFTSDLPRAAGMSSSSALVVLFALVFITTNTLDDQEIYKRNIRNNLNLAAYLAAVENGCSFGTLEGDQGVGTFGGSEDHTAILCSQPYRLGQFTYSPTNIECYLPVPEGYLFAIGFSGVEARKTGTARNQYNRAAMMVEFIVRTWQRETGLADVSLKAIISRGEEAFRELCRIIDRTSGTSFTAVELRKRLEHFIIENEEIVRPAGKALLNGNLTVFGRLTDRSQEISAALLGNQIRETIFLVRKARKLGAVAASAFGAGYGGSVWALIKKESAGTFLEKWSDNYHRIFPGLAEKATFFLTEAGSAAFQIG